MITEEIWKDIPNYEGLYQVSSLGRVKSVKRIVPYKNGKVIHRKERLLSLSDSYGQYYTVGLIKEGNHKTWNVHRLVAMAFIPNPNNLPCINHKDENKYNNLVDNLEWCSYSYNTKYNNVMRTRLNTRNNNQSHGYEKKVYQYDLQGNLVKVWDSVKSINRELGYKPTNISSCCLNKQYRKTAYGYKWSYESL